MKEPLIDNRGNTIEPGLRVAYNLSGQIAMGVVESATPAEKTDSGWRYIRRASIKVKAEYPEAIAGKISNVRDPKNVMVIFIG